MCGGRESPLRERSTIDAVVPQLQFDYGNMGDGLDRLYFSSFEQDTFFFTSCDTGARLQEYGHALFGCWRSQVGA